MPDLPESTPSFHLDDYQFHWAFLAPRYWPLWLWFAVLWLVTRLPYPAIKKLGHGFGWLFYHLGGKRRHYANTNIKLCFPEFTDSEREQMVRRCFAGCGLGILESGMVWWTPFHKLEKLYRVEGLDKVQQAHANGDNILMFGLHNSCIELAYSYISHFLKLHILFRVNDNPFWEYVAGCGRRRFGLQLLPRKQVTDFLNHMRQGDACLMLPDQDFGRKRSLFAPFFGIPTATVPSTGDFAAQTGARVIFVNVFREKSGYVIRFSDFLDNFPSGDLQADTARINQITEHAVREHPEQYLWLHRRFKTRPEGEERFY